jgi:mono/diheme cytochrome c family protein
MLRTALVFLLLASSAAFAETRADRSEFRGKALLQRMCAPCHAIGKTGDSPHIAAPAFRDLDRRLDMNTFGDRLREGLMSTHRDMPDFRFSREDARAVAIYLRSIQAP